MFEKCPGRDSRNLKAQLIRCACGYEVEIFSDEIKRVCPKCRTAVIRKELPSCASWCASAEQCLGFPYLLAKDRKARSGERAPEANGD